MNKWIKDSIKLANSAGYLDKLSRIYEMQVNPKRPLAPETLRKIKHAFDTKDDKQLIRILLNEADVFPVKDSYIGFIRKKPNAIDENPITVGRIAKRLYSLGMQATLREAQRSKETNRQLGNSFKKWIRCIGYSAVTEREILASSTGIVILKGSDKKLGEFARKKLKCKLHKGIDFVIKKDDKYVIGEAKFLTTPGGEQDRGFDDASNFINDKSGDAIRIVVLDGYIWLTSLTGLHNRIVESNDNIMSALVLKKFINDL